MLLVKNSNFLIFDSNFFLRFCKNWPVLIFDQFELFFGSGYFASRGKIAHWRQTSHNGYYAASAKIALNLILTQTLTLIPTLALTQTLTPTEEKHYFASRGKIAKVLPCFFRPK